MNVYLFENYKHNYLRNSTGCDYMSYECIDERGACMVVLQAINCLTKLKPGGLGSRREHEEVLPLIEWGRPTYIGVAK